MLYADTSALLPYYRGEAASAAVETLLRAQTEPVVISELTRVEFASALARWVRMGELTELQANRIESAFHEDLAEGRFEVAAVTSGVLQRANHWLVTCRIHLRALDSMQLACAEAREASVLALDEDLLEAAEHLGIPVHRLHSPPDG
ncbi:type II toxin-antitoxin system VapC family toxin [Thiohalorhabdus sp.]|uniref:type II toxin-antitoxin system VapC family toxin n=1 Tax=Thiohalorhabdus sp. TaxID=3094134 RepID=UPI002FC3704F